jgi:hypothetical protein
MPGKLKRSARICAEIQNGALTHPQAVARTLGPPAKYVRPDRLNDEFRSSRKVEACLSNVSLGPNDILLLDELLDLREVFRRGACGCGRDAHSIADLGVCCLAVARCNTLGRVASVAGDGGGHGGSENKAEQSRAHGLNTSSSRAGPQNSHLRPGQHLRYAPQ